MSESIDNAQLTQRPHVGSTGTREIYVKVSAGDTAISRLGNTLAPAFASVRPKICLALNPPG
jgi:hypothetical protein